MHGAWSKIALHRFGWVHKFSGFTVVHVVQSGKARYRGVVVYRCVRERERERDRERERERERERGLFQSDGVFTTNE